MKKSFFVLVIFSFFRIPISYGQDTLKAMIHNFTTELNVNLFQGQISLNNSINQVKVRYFLTNEYAFRLGFDVESQHAVNNSDQVYGTNPSIDNETGKATTISLNLGIEKHFIGTKRLSPYIGAELALGYRWSSYEIDNLDLTTKISGSWEETSTLISSGGSEYYTTSYPERGYFSYGLNFVSGFDFYVSKHLFIGYEFLFGFTVQNYTDINITYSGSQSWEYTSPPTTSTKNFSFGPNVINGIRIGYVF